MSEENLLTDEECETLHRMSKLPMLNIVGAGHEFRYYGVDREENAENIEIIEEIVKKICPDMVSFSNFTGKSPNRIRIQAHYSSSFVGVHYLYIPDNKPEVADE